MVRPAGAARGLRSRVDGRLVRHGVLSPTVLRPIVEESSVGGSTAGPAIRDTITAVFRDPAFSERSWAQLVWLRVLDLLRWLLSLGRGSHLGGRATFWVVVAIGAALLAATVARQVMRREGTSGRGRRGVTATTADAWLEAERAAGAGRYDVAAHQLYAAVVSALARAGLVRAHASKTVGDYLRELRRGGPGAAREEAVRAFVPFARGYQAVVYGPRAVDREHYEALRASAGRLVGRAA